AAGRVQPWWPLALGEIVGGVDRVERRDPLGLDVRNERVRDVREDDAGDHVDLVALDELAELGEGGRGQALVVLEDHLELPSGELPAALLPEELAAAVHVPAGRGDGARQR